MTTVFCEVHKLKLMPFNAGYLMNKSSAVLRLATVATIDMGRKEGAAVPLSRWGGELGRRLSQCGLQGAEVYFRTKWRLHPSSRLATIDMGELRPEM